jgi:hypothetical protein
MTLRASTDPSRVRARVPDSREDLVPGKKTTAHGCAGSEMASVGLLASQGADQDLRYTLAGVRAWM